MRAGYATTAAVQCLPEHAIQRGTGHKDRKTLLRYIRLGDIIGEVRTQMLL